MDVQTAVAVSMLPVSRLKAAAAFKEFLGSGSSSPLAYVLARTGLSPGCSEAREAISAAMASAEAALTVGLARGYTVIPNGHPRYPALLSCVDDPPPVLWMRGDLSAFERPCVAIVGSRGATPYALQVGRRLAAELAGRGIAVASGLARGVDSAAHEGCLEGGGVTLAVIGSGLDNIYPREHELLADSISSNGLVISELAPDGKPLAEHFPLRNRIISGISLAVVVVEASENSGSLITAACALRQGRDVMAVPGNVLSGRNRGSHALLKDGAKVVESADDILEDMGWNRSPSGKGPAGESTGAGLKPLSKSLQDDPLLSKMDAGEVYRLDELVELTGTSASKLLPRLMELELLGYIEAPGGGRFIRRVKF